MDSKSIDRIIVLVDMDCFYVQVEQKLCPEYQNKPCAVVQYNTWKGGGIIAVNYEARAKGVKRGARGEEAQRLCPDIHLFRVPEVRGKADLTRYREAGASVIEVLCEFSDCVERASIDEAYLDLTAFINNKMQTMTCVSPEQIPNTFVVGWEKNGDSKVQDWLQTIYEEDHLYKDRMLALAAVIVEEMRSAVYEKTGYRCSAGIAHNKMLSKLSCGLHKPNKQTVLPEASIPFLYNIIPVNKVRNLGGKMGEQVMQKFDVKMMGDLMKLSKSQFVSNFGEKSGSWLFGLSRGIENEPVTPRQLPKSIGCGKNFPGKSSLNTKEKVIHWVKQLCIELEERLLKDQENNRRAARLLTINVRSHSSSGFSVVSRSCPIYVYDAEKLAHDAFTVMQKFNTATDSSWSPSIWSLAMAAGKFEDKIDNASCDIQTYFSKSNKSESTSSSSNIDTIIDLMDSDKNIPTMSTGNISESVTEHQIKRTNDITSFFSLKRSNTSLSVSIDKTIVDETESSLISGNQDVSTTADKGVEKKIPSFVPDEQPKTDELRISNTSPQSENSNSESKKMGFFAKKLEERKKFHTGEQMSNEGIAKSDISLIDKTSFSAILSSDSHLCHENSEPSTSHVQFSDHEENSMSSVSSNTDLDPELTKLCPKCNKLIPIWEEEEHLDYHLALDLSKEFRQNNSVVKTSEGTTIGKSKLINQPKTRRKRGNMSKNSTSRSKKPSIQKNTLDSFIKS